MQKQINLSNQQALITRLRRILINFIIYNAGDISRHTNVAIPLPKLVNDFEILIAT